MYKWIVHKLAQLRTLFHAMSIAANALLQRSSEVFTNCAPGMAENKKEGGVHWRGVPAFRGKLTQNPLQ
jgi:hypothetical protein